MSEAERIAELADRVEALSGPDRKVDCLIADAVDAWPEGWIKHLPGMEGATWAYHNPAHNGEWMEAPAYTASLDAAMTLVPEGSWDHMEVFKPDHQTLGWTVHLLANGNFRDRPNHVGFAATHVLALCAAALRARNVLLSSLKGEGNG